jgi:hypothetical protein
MKVTYDPTDDLFTVDGNNAYLVLPSGDSFVEIDSSAISDCGCISNIEIINFRYGWEDKSTIVRNAVVEQEIDSISIWDLLFRKSATRKKIKENILNGKY